MTKDDISQLIGQKGGQDATYFEILGVQDEGDTVYFPSIGADGQEIPYRLGDGLDSEYWQHKARRTRYTVRLIVAGNPISAESFAKARGFKCFSTGPTLLDVYPEE